MNLLEQLTLAWQALRHTVPQLVRPRLWLWALPLAAAELLVVALLWYAAHPLVSWFMVPLLRAASGADTLHYPRIFEVMPALFSRADLVIGAVVGSIAFGAATPAFAERFRGEPVRPWPALGGALRRAGALVLVLLPFNLLLIGLDVVLRIGVLRHGGGLIGRVAPLATTGASLVVQAAFFYAVALVVLEGRSARDALRALPATWRPGFLAALLVSVVCFGIVTALHLPFLSPRLLVDRGVPELAGWLTVVQIGAGLLNGFLLTGAATLLYLSAVRPRLGQK